MQYLVTINKKSPMHHLWRNSHQFKARFLNTLFTYNKAKGQYEAQGSLVHIGRLMRHPHVHVTVLTAPTGNVTPIESTSQESDSEPKGKGILDKFSDLFKDTETETNEDNE